MVTYICVVLSQLICGDGFLKETNIMCPLQLLSFHDTFKEEEEGGQDSKETETDHTQEKCQDGVKN